MATSPLFSRDRHPRGDARPDTVRRSSGEVAIGDAKSKSWKRGSPRDTKYFVSIFSAIVFTIIQQRYCRTILIAVSWWKHVSGIRHLVLFVNVLPDPRCLVLLRKERHITHQPPVSSQRTESFFKPTARNKKRFLLYFVD